MIFFTKTLFKFMLIDEVIYKTFDKNYIAFSVLSLIPLLGIKAQLVSN